MAIVSLNKNKNKIKLLEKEDNKKAKLLSNLIEEAVAMFSVKPIIYVSKIANPFVKLLSGSTNILVKLVGFDEDDLEEKVSKEE